MLPVAWGIDTEIEREGATIPLRYNSRELLYRVHEDRVIDVGRNVVFLLVASGATVFREPDPKDDVFNGLASLLVGAKDLVKVVKAILIQYQELEVHMREPLVPPAVHKRQLWQRGVIVRPVGDQGADVVADSQSYVCGKCRPASQPWCMN
jgi:hypothetical protein